MYVTLTCRLFNCLTHVFPADLHIYLIACVVGVVLVAVCVLFIIIFK